MAVINDQKKLTKQRIFSYIYYAESPVSKPKIAEELQLSMPTVYQYIGELLDDGLIIEGEILKSTGGRPPVAYVVNKDHLFAVGVAVSANKLRFYMANALCQELGYRSVDIHSLESVEIGRQINEELPDFIASCGQELSHMIGLGITIPGVIDEAKQHIVFSPTMQMREVSLALMLAQIQVSVPIVVENDSTSAGYAELYSLPIDDRNKTFTYLFLEYGVGGAIFFEGKPYYGMNHRSGEFGHTRAGHDGLVCSCGKKDCLEAYIGAGRFGRAQGVTIEAFMAQLDQDDPSCKALWQDGIEHLARAIRSIRMVFDCEIVLGGFMTEYLEPYMDDIRAIIAEDDPFGAQADYLHIGRFAKRAGVIGLTHHLLVEYLEHI